MTLIGQPREPPPNIQRASIHYERHVVVDVSSLNETVVSSGDTFIQVHLYANQIKNLARQLSLLITRNSCAERNARPFRITEIKELSKVGKELTELVRSSQESCARAMALIDGFSTSTFGSAGISNKAAELKSLVNDIYTEKEILNQISAKCQVLPEAVKHLRKKALGDYEDILPSAGSGARDEEAKYSSRTVVIRSGIALRSVVAAAFVAAASSEERIWRKALYFSTAIGVIFIPFDNSKNACKINSRFARRERSSSPCIDPSIGGQKLEQCLLLFDIMLNAVETCLNILRAVLGVFDLLEVEGIHVISLLETESDLISGSPSFRDKFEVLQSLLPFISSALESYGYVQAV